MIAMLAVIPGVSHSRLRRSVERTGRLQTCLLHLGLALRSSVRVGKSESVSLTPSAASSKEKWMDKLSKKRGPIWKA